MRLNLFPEKEDFLKASSSHNIVPICSEILADTETPVSILEKIYTQNKGNMFLLESVEGGDRWGRYSFLGIGARMKLRIFREHVEIEKNGEIEKISHNGDPFEVMREVSSRYKIMEFEQIPRLTAGFVGYFTYEMVSFFEKINNKLAPAKSLAAFMVPETVLIFDNTRHTLKCVELAYIEEGSDVNQVYEQACENLEAIRELIKEPHSSPAAKDGTEDMNLRAFFSPKDYMHKVEKIKEHIYAGDVIQTVISQPFICDAPANLISLYRAQRYINPSPYMFFMDIDDRTLIGSSPETMVRLENGLASVRPIAGTRPRGANEQQDRNLADELLADEKERAEHLMLVDLGRNDLGRMAQTGTVQVTDLMVVERYSHVMHLVSNVVCDMEPDKDAYDLIKAVFPAGTLSGAPKVRAMELIAEYEEFARGPYGGCVGYIAFNGNMDMAITIRTATVEDGKLTIQAGAGIVADSNPEAEYVETVNKSMSIQRALQFVNDIM
ncbi:MAG: anthranilate synthase component I family protein [Sedimentisphaeraceae bacterium JB056]